jgi:hypothetical protein
VRLAAAVAMLTGLSAGVAAHHSFAMYDMSKTETLTGRLARFVPGANHAQIYFELIGADGAPVRDAGGQPVVWGVEMGPAAQVARQGITVKDFPPGTIMTVTLHPLRNGNAFGSLDGAIIKCGMEMPAGGCTAETGEVIAGRNN